jgi:periplasmic protein TonB
MNRKFATLGLTLSLILHAGLFLLPTGTPMVPGRTQLRVSLKPVIPSSTAENQSPTRAPVPKSQREQKPTHRPVPSAKHKKTPKLVPEKIHPPRPRPTSSRQPIHELPIPEPIPVAATAVGTPAEQTVVVNDHNPLAASQPVATRSNLNPRNAVGNSSVQTAQTGHTTPLVYLETPHSYPPLAKQRGWEGTVNIEVVISRNGTVKEAKLQQSSGHSILDRAALKQIRRWRFQPASVDGKPVEISALVPIVFELK